MAVYADSIEDFIRLNFPSDTEPKERESIAEELEAASRFFDAETGRPDNYFAAAIPDIEAAAEIIADPDAVPPIVGMPAVEFVDNSFVKRFYGNGRNVLYLPPFIDETLVNTPEIIADPDAYPPIEGVPASNAVITPDGLPVPKFLLVREPKKQYLQIVDANGWPSDEVWTYGQPFDIRAHWGYRTIPAQIKEAVLLIVKSWQQRESGILGQINPQGFYQKETDIPVSARTIINQFKADPLDDLKVKPLIAPALIVENCDSIFISNHYYYPERLR